MSVSASRPAGQANRFYPGNPDELKAMVEACLEKAEPPKVDAPWPLGFVVPHAGYPFSGLTAAHAYKILGAFQPETLFIFSPSHHARFPLASLWDGPAYQTPLGDCPINLEMAEKLRKALPGLGCQKGPDREEHSLEVQIPFVQTVCPGSHIVPLVVGDQGPENVAALVEGVKEALEPDCENLRGRVAFIASSDGYHGESMEECREMEAQLRDRLLKQDPEGLMAAMATGEAMACGYGAIAAVMALSRWAGAQEATLLHATDSGEMSGGYRGGYVVGYTAVMYR